MPRAEAGSSKAIGNAIKAKGLTKLRFYCQICEKACRDENGYKCHLESETHMRQIAAIGSNPNKVIDKFSKEFQDGFMNLLSRRFGTARVNANKVYQEYIQERHHLHMNATKWVSLSEFVKHLGREGIVKVEEITDEGQHGWYLTWVDNSPAALARQDALQKMARAKVDEEGRMRKFLNEQIERAREESSSKETEKDAKLQEGLQRDESRAPLKIGISLSGSKGNAVNNTIDRKPEGSLTNASKPPSTSESIPKKPLSNPFKTMNKIIPPQKEAPKLGGGFKMSTNAPSSSDKTSLSSSRPTSITAAEKIMAEEQAMRDKRKVMGPQPSAKRMRM
jgi:DNA/RNA-binding protein KIN17